MATTVGYSERACVDRTVVCVCVCAVVVVVVVGRGRWWVGG